MKISEILEGDVIDFPSPKVKQELDRLLNTKIAGNYKGDETLWNDLETFIMDKKNPMGYRVKALKKLDQVIGEVQPSYSAKDVEEYYKTSERERRFMYESEGLSHTANDRIGRAVEIFTHMMHDTPELNTEHAIQAASNMAHIHYGHELDKVKEECKRILVSIKKRKEQ